MPAYADEISDLKHFLKDIQSFEADFSQTLIDTKGKRTQSEGHFILNKPTYFYWVYHKPFKQQIIGDGQFVWVYDEDLAQIVKTPQSKATAAANPLLTLMTNDKALNDYQVTPVENVSNAAKQWIQLQSISNKDAPSLTLGFTDQALTAFRMIDPLGNHILIELHAVKKNQAIKSGQFKFKAPKGVDVLLSE
jgi:outer membrane lipoprotein carrier protein